MKKGLSAATFGALGMAPFGRGPAGDAADPLATLPPPREGVTTDRFARLALACIHKDYPNKTSPILNSPETPGHWG